MLAFLLASLGMGLFGSLHCLGMCGGLMAALSFGIPTGAARVPLMVLASAGRIISYGLMGALAGALLQSLAIGPWPRLVAAVLLILTGLYLAGWWNLLTRLEALGAGLWRRLEPLRKRCLPIDSSPKAIGFGLLWGALPCGLVYSALTYTTTAAPATEYVPQALAAALGMAAFGLGTSPAVLIGGAMASQLKTWLQKPFLKPLLGVSYIAFGLWTGYAVLGHHHHHHHAHGAAGGEVHGGHEGHEAHSGHSGHEGHKGHESHEGHEGHEGRESQMQEHDHTQHQGQMHAEPPLSADEMPNAEQGGTSQPLPGKPEGERSPEHQQHHH